MKRKHVTLSILWDEYIEAHPEGYRYSRFCELYRAWEGKISVTMRQTHLGGDKLFVDYAGDTAPVVIDRLTARSGRRRFLSPSWGHRTSPMRRRRGRNRSPTGSVRTRVPSRPSAGYPGLWCRTTPGRRSSRRACTSLRSTGPIRRWPRITASASCRRDRASHATRPRSKPVC
ncbi:putative transposase [Nitrobacter sp. Nb-311A]|nr:putative transposase [Nitrobacter sp. Nb-311A]